jgi:hypothetical protein
LGCLLFGRVEIIKLFLALPWLDPNEGFLHDCSTPHLEIVKLLLADQRLRTDDTRGLAGAALRGHVDVVRLLLADGRFDPSTNDEQVIDYPLSFGLKISDLRANCFKCAELLLADERVLISLLRFVRRPLLLCEAAVLDSRLRALLLLKRAFRRFVLSHKPEQNEDTDDEKEAKRAKLVTQIAQDPLMKEVLLIEKQILSCLDVYLISDLSALCVDYLPDYSACSSLSSPLLSLLQQKS